MVHLYGSNLSLACQSPSQRSHFYPLLSSALSPPLHTMSLKRKLERDPVDESDRDVGSIMGIAENHRD